MPLTYGLIQGVDLSCPNLPPRLVGARIAHLSDLHIRPTGWMKRDRLDRIVRQLSALRLDLLVLTGDAMSRPGDEPAAIEGLRRIVEHVRPRWGVFGVHGNHDTDAFIAEAQELPMMWLTNGAHRIAEVGLDVWGLGWPLDAVALARAIGMIEAEPSLDQRLRLALCHTPSGLPALADLGAHLVLAGHTHGGQIRLPTGHALRNSCDLPLHLSSGILRHGHTLAAVSRGVGEINIPLRLFCPPHIPLYTLRQGSLPGQRSDTILRIQHW